MLSLVILHHRKALKVLFRRNIERKGNGMLLTGLFLRADPAAPPRTPYLLALLPLVVGVATVSTAAEVVHRFIAFRFCNGYFWDFLR